MTKICLFIGGFNFTRLRIQLGNVESVFKNLKGRAAANCVIWFGSGSIGANATFCSKAAMASGCYVVAPVMALPLRKYPKPHGKILDGFAVPVVFDPAGKSMRLSDFCAHQREHNFTIPV